ncbi:MAG: translocation/assembly module TamB domain-containing protein [Acidobacteriia bacterium]|nr:translocation/assembly module TamB domain-containing protein [Terriglobia bacterium]
MSRRSRLAWIWGCSILGLAALLVLGAILVARSGWLREQVRQRIVAEAERATGGRVEIGSFEFEWRTLTARVNDFVIHGTEPSGSPPLLRVRSVTVVLKIISFLARMADVQSVDVQQPQVSLMVRPDGTSNVPQPKTPSKKPAVQTILDLAIGRFSVENGSFEANSSKNPWNAAGQNLRARFLYNANTPAYHGDISIQPLHVQISHDVPVDVSAKASLTIARNRVTVSSARLETLHSDVELSGVVRNFSSPEWRLEYIAHVSMDELLRTLRIGTRSEGTVLIGGNASIRDFGHYLLEGKLHAPGLSFRQGDLRLHDVRADAAFRADPDKIDLSGLRLAALGGSLNGRARIEKLDRLRLEGEASHFDLRRVAELFTPKRLPWDGLLSGSVELNGLLSDLNRGRFEAHSQLVLSPAPDEAPVRGVIDASYDGPRGTVDLGKSFVQLPATRADFEGTLGRQLRLRLETKSPDELLPALDMVSSSAPHELPVQLQNGSAAFNGTITGPLRSPQIAGHIALTKFTYAQEKADSLAADITAQNSSVEIRDAILTRGALRANLAATVALRDWKPDPDGALAATGSLSGADVQDVLAIAGKKDIAATGTLSASGQITGTTRTPLIKADVTVANGSVYGEPFDRLTGHIDYLNPLVTIANAKLNAGTKQVRFQGTYAHSPGDFETGRLSLEAESNSMALGQFHLLEKREPSIAGDVQITAKGAGTISKTGAGQPAFRLTSLSADVSAERVHLAQKPIGAVRLTVRTAGTSLTAHLESGVANCPIRADGEWRLADDYPGKVQIELTKLDLAALDAWLARPASSFKFAGSAEGKATISGPALKPEAWTASLDIPQLAIAPLAGDIAGGNRQAVTLRNQGPIRLTMQNSVVRVESARLVAQDTNLTFTGTVSFQEKNPLDLRVNGNLNLAVLENLNADFVSSGTITADAAIRGPLTEPLITGRAELKDANLNVATFPNGISHASGVILFTGDRATIQTFTGESGGGNVSVTGFASYAGGDVAFHFELIARQVRVRYPEGVSTVASARLTWTGSIERSQVSGTARIQRTGFNPRTDFASILAKSSEPVRTPATRVGLLGGMNFDIQIDTSPDVQVQSALAQQIQAEAALRLRGTASNPVLLGRINITQGETTFFGNKYTINQGSISFYNPVKLEPILNIDLQTRARGIDVTLTISGPMNKLNVTYRSDPPLQFSDIVALLATGRSPTSDVSLSARESGAAQSWQQLGASALVGQAIANPVAGRLQRFFGVSRIKIDPQLTGVENPQARLTLEQQVTPDITFTYITNVTRSNPQVVRIEWALNRLWSVVAVRDESGIFGLDFYYKKRFK